LGEKSAHDDDTLAGDAVKRACSAAGVREQAAKDKVEANGNERQTEQRKYHANRTGSLGCLGAIYSQKMAKPPHMMLNGMR
jgi:hypothetical protein